MSNYLWIILILVAPGQVWTRHLLQEQIVQILDPLCSFPPFRINLPSPFFPEPEISGGVPSATSNFPFIVSLQIFYEELGVFQHFCGGVLLKPNIVLTAGHCVQSILSGSTQVGSKVQSNLMDNVFAALNPYCRHQAGDQGRIGLQDYIIHEDYIEWAELGSDIALVRLNSSFDFNGPYPTLEKTNNLKAGTKAIVAGWGNTNELEATDNTAYLQNATYMRQAQVNYVPEKECRKELVDAFGFDIYQDTMLCFNSPENDTCRGDSGGPLIIYDFDYSKSDFIWRLLGLTSFGVTRFCDERGKVGVYIRISKFFRWITHNLEVLSDAIPPIDFFQRTTPMSSTTSQFARSIDIGVAGCVIQPVNTSSFLEEELEDFECEKGTVAYYFTPERICTQYTTCSTPLFTTLQDCQTTCKK